MESNEQAPQVHLLRSNPIHKSLTIALFRKVQKREVHVTVTPVEDELYDDKTSEYTSCITFGVHE